MSSFADIYYPQQFPISQKCFLNNCFFNTNVKKGAAGSVRIFREPRCNQLLFLIQTDFRAVKHGSIFQRGRKYFVIIAAYNFIGKVEVACNSIIFCSFVVKITFKLHFLEIFAPIIYASLIIQNPTSIILKWPFEENDIRILYIKSWEGDYE